MRYLLPGLTLMLGLSWTAVGQASYFGYSLNLNFGAEEPVIQQGGVFRDIVWNNFDTPSLDGQVDLQIDYLGKPSDSQVSLMFDAPRIGIADNVTAENPDDVRIMRGYLDSPSTIMLDNLDKIFPPLQTDATYSVILYTYGGGTGDEGKYRVNDQEQIRVDLGDFTGDYRPGGDGNVLVFKGLVGPSLTIETEGFGPVNAMSLIYCRPGDFNGDGVLDVEDLNKLNEVVKSGEGDFNFDVNFDLTVDFRDVLCWIKCSKGTCIGDVNLDGVFDSNDLIDVVQHNLYETDEVATWTTGDFNGDCKFDSNDLIAALADGCYESGEALSRPVETTAIPEPPTALLLTCLLPVIRRRSPFNREPLPNPSP